MVLGSRQAGKMLGCHCISVPVRRMGQAQRPKPFSAQKAAEAILVILLSHRFLFSFPPFPSRARDQRPSSHQPHPMPVHHPAHAQPRQWEGLQSKRWCKISSHGTKLHHPQSLPGVRRRKRGGGEGEACPCSHLFTFFQGILHVNSTL